jgi:predicted short-subunit dehydrogenase-like oxidoreductase (DUF2520 family)
MKVWIVGRGKVGRALTLYLRHAAVDATLLPRRVRLPSGPIADVLLFAVPDASISALSSTWAPRVTKRTVVMHVSGARGPEDLLACARAGAAIGTLHPLVSFAHARTPPPIAGATFTFHGERRAATRARALCRALGVHMLVRPIAGPAYHAAAAVVANGSAALAHLGVRILMTLGVPKREAERALSGLLATVAENIRTVGVPAALTGPVARGDVDTVRAHLRSLSRIHGELTHDYALIGRVILACALEAGLEPSVARELIGVLTSGSKPPPQRPRLPPRRDTRPKPANGSKKRRSRP